MDDKDEVLQWGYITKMVDRIQEEAKRLNWDTLIDEVIKIFDEATNETDMEKLFFELYQFLLRLYHRVRHFTKPGPFNVIYREIRQVNHEDADFFVIHNYDYKTFLWARNNNFTEMLDNGNIRVPKSALTPAQVRHFEDRLDAQR